MRNFVLEIATVEARGPQPCKKTRWVVNNNQLATLMNTTKYNWRMLGTLN